MKETLSFPGLGLEFNINPIAFHIGSRPVYWYGVIIAVGFLLAMLYVTKRANTFGVNADKAFDVTIIAVLLGIVGARVFYVAFSWDDFRGNIKKMLTISDGGLAIYGGIIFGLIGMIIACKIFKVKLLPMLDLAVGGLFIGQAIGRWGNFTNIEAFGGNTTLPWGMTSPSIERYLTYYQQSLADLGMTIDPTQPVHPTFLYESLWCLLGFLLIVLLTKKRVFDGELTLVYFAWYGFGRFFIEGLRTDSLLVGELRVSRLIGIVGFIISFLALLILIPFMKKRAEAGSQPVYANTPESAKAVSGELYRPKAKKDVVEDMAEIEEEISLEEMEDIEAKECFSNGEKAKQIHTGKQDVEFTQKDEEISEILDTAILEEEETETREDKHGTDN